MSVARIVSVVVPAATPVTVSRFFTTAAVATALGTTLAETLLDDGAPDIAPLRPDPGPPADPTATNQPATSKDDPT